MFSEVGPDSVCCNDDGCDMEAEEGSTVCDCCDDATEGIEGKVGSPRPS